MYALAAIALLGLAGAVALHLSMLQKARRLRVGRKPLSDEAFGLEFFPGPESRIAAKARAALARYIPGDSLRIHPDDELVRDLQLATVDGLDANAYLRDLEREFGVSILNAESVRWRSLRDVVTFLGKRRSLSPSN